MPVIIAAMYNSRSITVWDWVKNERLREIEVPSEDYHVTDIMKFNNETLIVSGYKKLSIWKLFFAKK
jgi:hypothetical protein